MTDAGFVYAGYAVTGAALAGYAAWLLRRVRAAARDVTDVNGGEQPWR